MIDISPRKLPRQARARATVDAIIEATIQLLLREGYDRFTTARVAERAGVSIGSLYQYFPNKAALASAVIDKCGQGFLVAFQTSLASHNCSGLDECVRAIIESTLLSHHLAPTLHKIVNELSPRIGVTDKTEKISQSIIDLIERFLRQYSSEIADGTDIAVAATIIEMILESAAHRFETAQFREVPAAVMAQEIERLITAYLTIDKTTEQMLKDEPSLPA